MFRGNSFHKRQGQNRFFARLGKIGLKVSLGILISGFIGYFVNQEFLSLFSIGMITFYISTTSSLIFSRLAWSENLMIDLVFNQACILVAFTGFVLVFLFVQSNYDFLGMGHGLIVLSFIMAWIGNRIS
jgi:hypothetical protein